MTGFTDDLFTSQDASERATWDDRAASANAGIIRISVNWASVSGSNPPLTPTSPTAYNLSRIDAGVKSAAARGLSVMLTVYNAPRWAIGPRPPQNAPSGTWKPDPKRLKQFGQALATRYSGHFPGVPRVKYFEAWTEPNLKEFLSPQWNHKKAESPDHYRSMLNAFYKGVHAGQPSAKVIGGATAPYGNPPGGVRMRPLTFFKDLFCLKGNYKPKKCGGSVPHLDILSHHPINFNTSPHHKAFNKNDAPIANFSRIKKVMKAAEKAHNVKPGGNHPLWATEIFWYSKPPSPIGVPAKKEARWFEDGLYLLWKQGASAAINFQIRDPKFDPQHPRAFYTGVFFHSGKKKPAFKAFHFPFVTHRKSKHKVSAWGKAPASGKLKIQAKKHGGWQTKKKLNVHSGQVFKKSLKLRGKASLRARIGNTKSLTWHQGS